MSICVHCGLGIRQDDVTNVWRHTRTRATFCYNSTVAEPLTTFTCPVCGAVSSHPEDLANGYCGACHAFTGVALKET